MKEPKESSSSSSSPSENTTATSLTEEQFKSLSESAKCVFVSDDYESWSIGGKKCDKGKPFWVGRDGGGASGGFKHIFFDDNVKNSSTLGIVNCRVLDPKTGCFTHEGNDSARRREGKDVVKVFAVRAAVESGYFLEQIYRCWNNSQP